MVVSAVTLLAAFVAVGGSLTYVYFPAGLSMGLNSMINLREGGPVYNQYTNPPFKTDTVYYIFELKNPKTSLTRANVHFSNSGEILNYESGRRAVAVEESSADFEESFYMLNPVVPSIATSVRAMVLDKVPFKRMTEPIVYNAVSVLLDQYNERLVSKKTPREFLEGTRVGLLDFVTSIAARFGLAHLVKGPPNNIFGIIYAQNETIDPLQVFAGLGSTVHRFGEVYKWKGSNKVPVWRDRCAIIDGNNGELYKPLPTPGKPIKVFLPQLCRSFTLDPAGNLTKVHDNMNAYEYHLSERLYKGVRSHPANKCFCEDMRTYDCQLDGLIKMGPCFFDAPLFFTRLDFKGVDPRIRDMIDGDSQKFNLPFKQSFYLDPITGTPLRANMSFVATFKVVRQPYLRDTARIQNLTYFPAFVAGETFDLPSSVNWQVRAVQIMFDYHKPAGAVAAVGGAVTALLRTFFMAG